MVKLRNLPPADLAALGRVGREQPQQSAFAHCDEAALGKDEGSASKHGRLLAAVLGPAFVSFPSYRAGLPFDASQDGVWLVAPGETIKVALVQDGLAPVHFQRKAVPCPDEVCGPGLDIEGHGEIGRAHV